MRVAILSSEAVPFAKTGGLADVSGALPNALHAEGIDSLLILATACGIRFRADNSPRHGFPLALNR